MRYVADPTKLVSIVKTLGNYEKDVEQYFLAELNPRVMLSGSVIDKLSRLFILANADRLGTGKGNENVKIATATFRKRLDDNVVGTCRQLAPKEAHSYFLNRLCDIKGMDQKTANLLLKYLVMFQDEFELHLLDWKSWQPHLHVPLDMWVLRLMGKHYLNVCGSCFEDDFWYKKDYMSPSFKTEKYNQLQTELREIISPTGQAPITLDMLWFVGSKYCNYRPLLCDICWLRDYCVMYEKVDWNEVPTKLKSTEREERREERKQINRFVRGLQRIWVQENPGKTVDDFIHFLNEPDGKKWLEKYIGKHE